MYIIVTVDDSDTGDKMNADPDPQIIKSIDTKTNCKTEKGRKKNCLKQTVLCPVHLHIYIVQHMTKYCVLYFNAVE